MPRRRPTSACSRRGSRFARPRAPEAVIRWADGRGGEAFGSQLNAIASLARLPEPDDRTDPSPAVELLTLARAKVRGAVVWRGRPSAYTLGERE